MQIERIPKNELNSERVEETETKQKQENQLKKHRIKESTNNAASVC